MNTTVLISNALLLVITGYALKRDKDRGGGWNSAFVLLLIVNIIYMGFENVAFNLFDVETSSDGYTAYYMVNCAFFLAVFGIFFNTPTKVRCKFALCMAVQGLACWLWAVNGAVIAGYVLFDSIIVYYVALALTWVAWAAEMHVLLEKESHTVGRIFLEKIKR